ncbi:putative dynamin-related protein 4A [Lycium barbarum]|uniref:putative dynamin-related protein 4A n=1 Tax=Lycium barbarum TaxID=112863 RepID=UPI00293EEE00|nr:putative dynamin-related protein 4A [Lycium barbarum]
MDISEKKSTPQEQEEDDDYIAPIVSSYNEKIICTLFNCVDRLPVTQQCIQPPAVPTIVLVGDKCSGKSSLVASLIGIKIPCFCTRVPILIKLQNHHSPKLEFSLEFDGKERTTSTDYNDVALEITRATKEIAGTTSGISNKALTLILKKNGFPDLTIVDLPGIPTALDNDEANNKETCEQIIMKYITPEDRIILNVLSGSSDSLPNKFESMNMCKKVDKKCGRTLVVVTKADNAPHKFLNELVLDKVTAMGFNFVCVRNNIDAESFKESESAEATLFELVPPTIDKTLFGIRVLARKLMLMQAKITSIDITRKIKDRLDANISDLKKLPNQRFSSVAYGLKEFEREILLRGDQFDEDCSTSPRSIVEMLCLPSILLSYIQRLILKRKKTS